MSLKMRLVWTLIFFGPATYFLIQRDFVAAAILSVAGFSAFTGYRAGVLSIFASLMAITAAIVFAPTVGIENSYRFEQWFGTTGLTNRFLAIGLVGLAIGLFVLACLGYTLGRTVRRRASLDRINRSLGFGFGMVQGVAGLVFFIGGMLVMEPLEHERAQRRDSEEIRGKLASTMVLRTAEAARSSVAGPYLVKYNPLTRIPRLNKIEQFGRTAEVLSDPVKLNKLLEEPEIRAIREKPEVQRLVSELNRDPKIQEMLASGQPMSADAAMTLLNHPAVMYLIDTPGFVEEASKAIQRSIATPRFTN